jgi:hypothetical protein
MLNDDFIQKHLLLSLRLSVNICNFEIVLFKYYVKFDRYFYNKTVF